MSINDRVIELIAEKAEVPVSALDPGQTLAEIGLDSLHLVEITMWMRKEYDVVMDEDALRPDHTLGAAISYLATRTG